MLSGITQFCFTRDLPSDAIAIARLSSSVTTPADLVDINNSGYNTASLNIWKYNTPDTSPADFVCPDYNQPVIISGSTIYRVDNQFFEVTNVSLNGVPFWYQHSLPAYAAGNVAVLNLDGTVNTASIIVSGTTVYHNLTGAYLVQYSDTSGYLHTDLLSVEKIFSAATYQTNSRGYLFVGRQLTMPGNGNYYLRFTQPDGYMALSPWSDQSNTPWYVRVRYPLNPFPIEWSDQVFSPEAPYMEAAWVPGAVLSSSIIEFERKDIYLGTSQLPDILVYDKDYKLKYAIDGSAQGTPKKKGNQFPWKRGLIKNVDAHSARVAVTVDLASTDIAFAFYSYQELDIIYREIDVNPFTNPTVKNQYIQIYVKTTAPSGFKNIYYKVVDPATGDITATNDSAPTANTPVVISTISVGANISTSAITVTDIRQRGGGLTVNYQDEQEANSFWDLGYWDGRPYPIEGAMIVYLPISVLSTFDRSSIKDLIQQTLPAGAYPVVKFYSPDGTESI